MGILFDMINKKAKEIIDRKVEEKQGEVVEEEQEITPYNRLWLERIAHEAGYVISGNEQKVDNILKALNKRDGHCPCGGMTQQFVCPCEMMRNYGECKCGLYVSAKDIDPKDAKSTGRIKE